jgi:hypothetical protein
MGGGSVRPATVAPELRPVLGWRLPKTVLDVTMTYVPTACTQGRSGPDLQLDTSVSIVSRAVPDLDLGPDHPNGVMMIDPSDATSFWVDTSISYKIYPDRGGLLQSLSSHPVSEVGPIIGNVLTGIVKIGAAAAGVPAPAAFDPLKQAGCGTVVDVLNTIKQLRARIPNEDAKKAADDAVQIQNLRDSMTVTMKRTVDTGASPPDENGMVATISPAPDKVKDAGWYSIDPPSVPAQSVVIRLDFGHGALLAPPVPREALFRQAAYVPVEALQDGKTVGQPKIVPFAQYGAARTIPLRTKIFRDVNWQLEFADTGEVTSAIFGNKAQGLGASTLFSGAATAASQLQTLGPKADSALDSDTLRLQAENAALKAQVDNKTLRAQLDALNAGSKPQ